MSDETLSPMTYPCRRCKGKGEIPYPRVANCGVICKTPGEYTEHENHAPFWHDKHRAELLAALRYYAEQPQHATVEAERDALAAKIAAVEALCDSVNRVFPWGTTWSRDLSSDEIRAALRDEEIKRGTSE